MAQRRPMDETEETDQSETPLDEVTATYVPRTALGRRLMAIRAEIVRSGVPLLSWDDVEREVAERRGGTILREYEERHEA